MHSSLPGNQQAANQLGGNLLGGAGKKDLGRCWEVVDVTVKMPGLTAMPQFAVFFSDSTGFGIVMVHEMGAVHNQDITRAQHPTGKLSAVPAECSTARTATRSCEH